MNRPSSATFRRPDAEPVCTLSRALEDFADQLLADSLLERPAEEYPFLLDSGLRRRRERDAQGPLPGPDFPPSEDRLRRRTLRLLQSFQLPLRQRLAVLMLLRGQSPQHIAATLRVDLSSVHRWFDALSDLLREHQGGAHELLTDAEALREVYLAEVTRHGHTPERHCRPGHEACRHTGLCTRRWYLHDLAD